MANTIKIKRGLSSNISNATLEQGELAITTDTQDLYVGTDSGNKKVGGGPKNILDGKAIGSARTIGAKDSEGQSLGEYAWAEGQDTIASGLVSHAEGNGTTALGDYSHAEGNQTEASGQGSHAEGTNTTASSYDSHAEGNGTTASNKASHVCGHYNAAMTDGGASNNTTGTAFVIGNGTKTTALSNAFSVQFDGTVKAKSTITASTTADYAEFFE